MGTILTRQGKLDEAEKCYRKALELNTDYVIAYCNLAVVLVRQNRAAEARELYEKALAVEPGNERAKKGMEELAPVLK